MPLAAPSVTSLTLDEAPQRLWLEWLESYFDGGSHTVGASGVTFPAVEVAFDQGALSQPLSGVGITVVCESVSGEEYLGEERKLAWCNVLWTFYVRSPGGVDVAGDGNARHQVREAAQLLRGLLQDDEAVRPLGQRGMQHLRVTAAAPVPGTDYAVRSVRVRGQLHYEV
jgi:hypothetical protein